MATIGFGLGNPALYSLIHGDPRPGAPAPAAIAAADILAAHIRCIAEAGRLVHAAGSGTTLTLIGLPADRRRSPSSPRPSPRGRPWRPCRPGTDVPASAEPGPAGAAIALRAVLPQTSALTAHEPRLLEEWLDRISRG